MYTEEQRAAEFFSTSGSAEDEEDSAGDDSIEKLGDDPRRNSEVVAVLRKYGERGCGSKAPMVDINRSESI